MSIIDQCTEYKEVRKICVAEENGKVYRLINTSGVEVAKVKVDKCLPQNAGEKRCDYLMVIDNKQLKRAIFIELKGSALNDAVKQVYETIIYLSNEFRGFQQDVRIVGSRDVPRLINTPGYVKLFKLIKLTKGKIERSTNKFYSENI